MSAGKITVGVVGLGSIARKAHLPVLAAHPGVAVIALTSRTGAYIAALESQYRLNLTARSWAELLAVRPQAAYVLSATESHPDVTVALLEAGIAVYLEKPLAIDLADARKIVEATNRPGRLLMVGFNRRYAPIYRQALAHFSATGRRVELVQVHKHRHGDHSGWPVRQIIMDDAIHIIDLARFIAGPDLQRRSSLTRLGLMAAQLHTPDGVVAQISQSYGAGAGTERLELHGGGLSVIVAEMERLTVVENGIPRTETIGGSWTSSLEKKGIVAATEHFLDCVRSGAQPETSAAEALRTQELAESILLAGEN